MADGAQHSFENTDEETGAGHAFHPPEVWAAARDDYQAGLSGPEVCAKYGLKLGTLRHRASAGGWRRADRSVFVPDEGLALEAVTGGDPDQIEYHDLVDVARGRMMRAVLRGAAAEALRWKRVSDVMQAEQDKVDRWFEHEEARRRALWTVRAAAEDSDGSDCSDCSDCFSGPESEPA